ncbi:MAG: Prolyl oligopeptidase family protein [Nevskia sp.]|nr:Prolyl oligopeptidase family protein [Nevskia sp.]
MRHLLWLAALASLLVHAAEIPVADFARDEDITRVKISPTGKYLAEVRYLDGSDYLAIVSLADRRISGGMKLGKDRRVAQYWWVGADRVVISFAEQQGALAQPRLTGELVALDAEKTSGRPLKYLFGYRGFDAPFASHFRFNADAEERFASVIRALPENGRKAIIQVNDFTNALHPDLGEIDRLDVYSGARELVSVGPTRSFTQFLADAEGQARYALSSDEHSQLMSYVKEDEKSEWKLINSGEFKDAAIIPKALSVDNHRVFLLSTEDGDRLCLVEQSLDSGARRKLSCDGAADVSDLVMSFDGKEPIAALYTGAPPWERVLDSTHPDAAKLRGLQKSFPGQVVVPVSATTDGAKVVLRVHGDRSPGDYYLFDTATMHADLLASQREWIDAERMSPQQAVEFKARDGQSLHGLLTLPLGAEGKNLPLVVNPHGGPLGILDTWGWDAETQLLASRGYAVLQVNFRGSGGYGMSFMAAGRQRWDSVMIDDITDGTRWAIAQGIADAGRICIYGGSYGGYAALMSAVREPDLYRCTIGYAGVYDLGLWKSDTDISGTSRGRTFLDEFVGTGTDRLKAASPLTYIDHLRAAVMIVHGEEDERVPVNQAKALRRALDARHYPYEWLVKSGEGHGFYEEKNREEFYRKMLAFLDRNIGPHVAVPKVDAAPSGKDAAAAN